MSAGSRARGVGSSAPNRRGAANYDAGGQNQNNNNNQNYGGSTSPHSAYSPNAPFGNANNPTSASGHNAGQSMFTLEHFDLSEQAFAAEDYQHDDSIEHGELENNSATHVNPSDDYTGGSEYYSDYNNIGQYNNNTASNTEYYPANYPQNTQQTNVHTQSQPVQTQPPPVTPITPTSNTPSNKPQMVHIVRRVSNQTLQVMPNNQYPQGAQQQAAVTKLTGKPTAIQIRKSSHQTSQQQQQQAQQLHISNLHSRGVLHEDFAFFYFYFYYYYFFIGYFIVRYGAGSFYFNFCFL
jgi:hypothetical protein